MEPPVIIEILDRFGKIRERVHVDQFPCRIGRGYHNDIIIDDPYISPSHLELRVDENNNLLLHDLGSDNGSYRVHPLRRLDSLVLEDNQLLRIGHTDLRLRSTQCPVKETVRERGKPQGRAWRVLSFVAMPLTWLLVSGLVLWDNYLGSVTEVTFSRILGNTLPDLMLIPLWAFIWSVVSKIVTHRFYFAYHLFWVSLLLIILHAAKTALQYVEFMTAIDFLANYGMLFTVMLLITVLVYGHLRYSTTYAPRKSAVIATITGLLLTAAFELPSFLAQPEFNPHPQFSGLLKPPAFVVRDSKSLDAFFNNSTSLREFTYGTNDDNGGEN